MQRATAKALAFRLLAATTAMTATGAFLAATAPPVRAAQVGGVQGTIKDANGAAVAGAQVQLIPQGGAPRFARTDASGYYSFAGVDPGTYTIQVSVVTFNPVGQPVSIAQDINSTVDFTLTKRVLTRRGAGITIPLTKTTDTQTDQVVTAEDERREKSQPNNLYQSTGLLNYKTGVTVDAGQYPHVRGSDGNQINWSIDGIDLRDPITNQFATNLVTAGISSSNVITGGADASYGGSAGAYLNQISANGREISKGKPYAGFIEQTNGPGSKWGYSGANVQVGGVLLNNKLDYALSSIVFKTKYGDNTQLGELHSSHDEVGKFNYYAGPNDTFTTFFAHGAENYNSYQIDAQGNYIANTLFFDPDRLRTDPKTGRQYISARNLDSSFNDHNLQTYNLDHFTYKHNFAPSSYLQYRIYQLHQAIPNHQEATGNFYDFDRTNVTGNQINYYNQLNKSNTLQAGLEYKDAKGSFRRQIVAVSRGDLGTLTSGLLRYSDRTYNAYPQDFALYLSDQLRAAQDKLVFNYGLRFQSTTYKGGASKYADSVGNSYPGQYTTKSTDPRLGLTFTPAQDLTFRSSYTVNSQHADERRIERFGPEDVGAVGTSLNANPLIQSRDAYRAQGFSRVSLSHSKDFDLGVEKGFNLRQGLLQGAYNFGVTGYQKYGYDIAFLRQQDYLRGLNNVSAATPTGFANIGYNNDGTQHASGFEFSFRKLQRRPSDWSGYLNYTNQVVRTNSSLYDTAYAPYFVTYLGTSGAFTNDQLQGLARREFAPSWDQRHTVALVAHKNLNKLFGATFILDAGSGLPFYAGASSNGNFGAVSSGFADIGVNTTGGADFTQVPISLGGGKLPPLNPLVGYTGWHYKVSVNTDFNVTDTFSLFLNVDNVFDKKTALSLATGSFSGVPYYNAPSAAYPQGQEVYKYQSKLTPVYLTFGFRQRF